MAEFLTPDLCVIGGGAAGLAVATRARRHGASVVVVEPGRLGGMSLDAGAVPSKALVAAGRRAEMLRTAAPFGIANAEPRINARAVFDHVHAVIDAAALAMTPAQLETLGIMLVAASGRFVDRRTLGAGDQQIRARRFVIATGSRPRVPTIAGLEEVPFFTSTSIFDNPRKLTHLVILGGQAIGIELAQAFRRLDAEVTVVEEATPLAGFDPELAAVALRRLAEEGVTCRAGMQVVAVQPRSLGIGVVIRPVAGGPEEGLDASHILVALGQQPALDGLDLERAGIRRRRGAPEQLALGRSLRTSNRRVYAVGDAAGAASTPAAARQAELVVNHALFGLPGRLDPDRLPAAVFTDPELAEIGLTEPRAKARRRPYKVWRVGLDENDRARIERQGYGLVKLVTTPRGRLIGAGVVGSGGAELLALFAFAIANRLSLAAFRRFAAPDPTLAEIARAFAAEADRATTEPAWRRRLMALVRLLP